MLFCKFFYIDVFIHGRGCLWKVTNCRPCVSSRKLSKSSQSFKKHSILNSIFCRITDLIAPIKVSIQKWILFEEYSVEKKTLFLSRSRSFIVEKFPKVHINDLTRCSNSIFSITTVIIPSIKVSIEYSFAFLVFDCNFFDFAACVETGKEMGCPGQTWKCKQLLAYSNKQTLISPKAVTWFPFSRFQTKVFYLWLSIFLKSTGCFFATETW